MTLEQLNNGDAAIARAALLRCCGSSTWAEKMLIARPFDDGETLQATAESLWWTLAPEDWLEAFSAHPKIGQNKVAGVQASSWSAEEQSAAASAAASVQDRLAAANEDYQRHFGWIFLVNATGKSAPEMLGLLEARLHNTPDEELRVAAGEQAKITRLRLNKLLDE